MVAPALGPGSRLIVASTDAIRAAGTVRTHARWLGSPDRPLLGWVSAAGTEATASGVLLLAPVGYEWWSTHRTLRTVAERLAGAGHVVLRLDLDGTADSAGDQRDAARVDAWRASARHGAEALRALGCRRLTVVGVRLGGLLALVGGAALEAHAVVVWAPVLSGRRLVKELRMLSVPTPGDDGTLVSAGTVFTAETLADLGAIDARKPATAPAPLVGLVGDGLDALAAHLRGLGSEVEQVSAPGGETALERPTEYATVPGAVVEALAELVGPSREDVLELALADAGPVTLPWRGAAVREEIVRLGPRDLVGVLTTPLAGTGGIVVVWLNSGSEPHVGPGRAWVEYARGLALRGHASLRVDFSGWGESPDRGRAPGRPYDAHGEDEVLEVVAALRERGHDRVVLAGLCAGAWIALRAILREPVAGVVALNPQLYWEAGDPVEATMAETRLRRTPERVIEERGRRWGWWTLLDILGRRPWAGRWLDAVVATGVPVLLLFAEGDDGIEYLRNRVSRRLRRGLLRGSLRVAEMPEIDHSMHRVWLRDDVVARVGAFVDGLR